MNDFIKGYVLGFFFDKRTNNVLLINKTRPISQWGKLNGVGGKIEPGEFPLNAMVREFSEEIGFTISNWRHYATMHFTDARIYVFSSSGLIPTEFFEKKIWPTDEIPELVDPNNLPSNVMTNLRWLLPMACDVGFKNCLDVIYNEGNDK